MQPQTTSTSTPERAAHPPLARSYAILCLILLAPAVFFVVVRPWGQTADFWETAAAVRAVAQDFLHPDNPLLALPGNTSPRFTPYTLFWGAVMKLGPGIFTTMALAGLANFALFVTGLFRFIRGEFRSLTLPVYVLIIMLVVWGTGYGQANAYQLRMFLEGLPYVGFFTYGVCFHGLAFLRRYLMAKRWQDLLWYTLLMATAFVTHPITALFGFTVALAMLAAERNWQQLILMQAVPLVALSLALAWPYFDYWTVLTRGSSESWFDAPLFHNQAEALGPALIGLPIAGYFALKRRHLMAVYGLVFCTVIYLVSYALHILIGSRFLLYATFFLHLAIALYLYEQVVHRRRSMQAWLHGHGYLLIIVFMLFGPGLWYRAHEMAKHVKRFYTPLLDFHAYQSPVRDYFFLRDYLHENDVVMADDTTGFVVPAITGAKIVSPQKGDPLITAEINLRRQAEQAFFNDSLTTRQRAAIARRYHVTHILVDESRGQMQNDSFRQSLSEMSRPEARQGAIALYRIEL